MIDYCVIFYVNFSHTYLQRNYKFGNTPKKDHPNEDACNVNFFVSSTPMSVNAQQFNKKSTVLQWAKKLDENEDIIDLARKIYLQTKIFCLCNFSVPFSPLSRYKL